MPNPFDLKTVLLAKHAQHVVLVHFPIALFIAGTIFDLISYWTKRQSLSLSLQAAAYYNFLGAAISTPLVLGTGLLAWQLQLEGQKLKGLLLLHLIFACVSSLIICLVWWIHFRARQKKAALPIYRLAIELFGVAAIAVTGHLGGFISGVNI